MSLPKPLLFLSLLLLLSPSVYSQEDIFNPQDLYNIPLETVEVQEDVSSLEPSRLLSSYPHIRIVGNFDNLASAPADYAAYIQNDLVPPVLSWFQAAIAIKYPVTSSIKLGSSVTSICGVSTPPELFTGVQADFLVIFNSKLFSSTTTVASSKVCYLATGTRRPLVATSIFNRNILVAANGDVLVHEKNIYLTIHEMMHNLAFSNDLFPYFMDENGKVRTGHVKSVTYYGKATKVIDLPPLTANLQKFFGCSSLEGAYLENDGSDGTTNSHFERKIFVYETMSSGVIYSRRVSQFSLNLLEGSGWYVPDYDYAEPYYFGQGSGCDFIFGACANAATQFASEYCSGSVRGCTPWGDGAGTCFNDTLTEGCAYVMPNKAYSCENADAAAGARLPSLEVYGRGLGSKCFTGTLNSKSTTSKTSFCFKYTCSGSGSTTKLTVKVGTKSVVCSKAGTTTVSGYYGTINCPDPLEFCSTVGKPYCPRNCMGRGTCVDSVCQCSKGFTGADCALNA